MICPVLTSLPVIDGDDVASFDATTATVRVGNYTQIRRRSMIIADNLGFQDLGRP